MSPDQQSLEALKIERTAGPSRSEGRRWGWWLILLLMAAAATVWLGWHRAPVVRTAAARAGAPGASRTVLNASGYVTARRQATVSSKATGKVVEVLIEEGQRVEAGQLLARLDDANIKASLELGQAQLQAARSGLAEIRVRLTEASNEWRRIQDLNRHQVSSQSELDRQQAELDSLKARLDWQQAECQVADRQVQVWQHELDDRIIRAPFSGIVVTKNAQPGEMISPVSAGGGFTRTGICTIVDMSSLEIEVDVNESYINRVQAHQEVEAVLDAYPSWKIPAKVIAIIPTADRQKATVKVRVGFNQLDPRLLPEMGVKVAFHSTAAESEPPGVLVPKTAVRREQTADVVYLARNGKAERRVVTLGSAPGTDALVVTGLVAGEFVIVQGPNALRAGDRVREARP